MDIDNISDIFSFFSTCTYIQSVFLKHKKDILKRMRQIVLMPCILNKIIKFKEWREKRNKYNVLKLVTAHHELYTLNDKKSFPSIIQVYGSHKPCEDEKFCNFKYELILQHASIIRFVTSNVPIHKYEIYIYGQTFQIGHDIPAGKIITINEEYGGIICPLVYNCNGILFSCTIEEKYFDIVELYESLTYLDNTEVKALRDVTYYDMCYYSKFLIK